MPTTFAGQALGAVVFCLVRTLSELRCPRPRGAVRTAVLTRRTVAGLGGRRLVVLALTFTLGAVAVVVFGCTAAPDGRTITSLSPLDERRPDEGPALVGPYPGWPFGIPILVELAAVALAMLLALWVVTRRPPLALVPSEHDDEVRRTSAARIAAGVQLWTGSALGLMAMVAAGTLRDADRPAAALAASLLGPVLMLVSLAVAATAVHSHRALGAAATTDAVGGVAAHG